MTRNHTAPKAPHGTAIIERDEAELEDPILYGMRKRGEPITRENYIRHAFHPTPVPYTAAHESELPAFLQDHKKFPELA